MSHSHPPSLPWSQLEGVLARDPGGRGIAGFDAPGVRVGPGSLRAAALALAEDSGTAAILTGFCIADAEPPIGETDGPPGALVLAKTLSELGRKVLLLSDRYTMPLLEVGCDLWGLERSCLREIPFESDRLDAPAVLDNSAEQSPVTLAWVERFLADGDSAGMSRLISVERAGPSHTVESLSAQARTGAAPVEDFLRDVPPEHRNTCHNMRGLPINGRTAKAHLLFDVIRQRKLPITTIGIGDGGNEIGLGEIPWELLRKRIAHGPGGRIACRVPCDVALLSGVSNWGAYALAAATAAVLGRPAALPARGEQDLHKLIEALVREGGAVDGVTKRREATVDGLPPAEELNTYSQLRRLCGS